MARVACVAWRFWLDTLSNKGGRGQRNREEIGAGGANSHFFSVWTIIIRQFAMIHPRRMYWPMSCLSYDSGTQERGL